MADYRRFVSYIYLYEKGVKAINTGFAKVESRGGQCRINITMKNMYHESNAKFSVYMFVRNDSRLLGIYLGDLQTENSTGEFNGVTQAENIENSGYGLDQVAGMIILGNNGKIYGTGWDDEALRVDAFIPLETAGKNEYLREHGENTVASAAAMDNSELRMESPGNTPIITDDAPIVQDDAPLVQDNTPMVPDNSSAPMDNEPAAPDNTPIVSDNVIMAESLEARIYAVNDNTEAAVDQSSETEEETFEESGRRFNPGQNSGLHSVVAFPTSAGEVTGLDKVIDKGLRMYPFEDDQVAACIRMEPQDIGMLPMKYWKLANNSFLLHGYYSYRHLIMARMRDGKFILGIPGVNYEREQFMASMFGFGKFKPVQKQAAAGNGFGYWYMELAE